MSAANREKRRIEGRCVTCGSSDYPITIGRTVCSRCHERQKAWRNDPKNRDKVRAWGRDWRERNRERSRELNTKYNRETKQQIMAHYGGACICCGETTIEFLTLDHINNDGGQDRKSARVGHGGYRHYKKLLQGPPRTDLQILCLNCHHAKTFMGTCPHEARARVDLDALARDIVAWQAMTFPQATPASVAEHLKREAVELTDEPSSAEEIADVFHLLVAAAAANGYDLGDIVATKLAVNQARRWGQPDPATGVVEHLKEAKAP